MKNITYGPSVVGKYTRLDPRQTALLCPACSSEIGLTELVERNGYVGCINCAK